ncbi:DinB family protein [Marininema halotolerans]|nr:DinB family protein [Marininema halotolerans]
MDLILHECNNASQANDWFISLKQALAGLTAEQASWKPEGENISSIWELTSHMLYYKERLFLRLQGKETDYSLSNEETFHPSGHSQADWDQLVNRMLTLNDNLLNQLQTMRETDFSNDTSDSPLWQHISNIIHHDVYHTGQMVTLRKLQKAWHPEPQNA